MQQHKNIRGSNQREMRAYNERLIMSLIRENGPLPKAELARMSGLSAQTVSVIIRGLEKEEVLKKGDPVRGKVGQPSVPMHLSDRGAFFLGLKIGRRSMDLILMNFVGQVIGRVHLTHPYPAPDAAIRFANQAVAQLIDQLTPDEQTRVQGMGIALPFRLWDWAETLNVPKDEMNAFRNRDIQAEIQESWDFPVYLENDATAACGAELILGTDQKPPSFLYIYIGYFIGGGIVVNSAVYTGPTGNAGAFGSIPILGKAGKVQQLVEVASLENLDRMLIDAGDSSNAIWDNCVAWPIDEKILDQWISTAAPAIGTGIAAATSILDLEAIYIDGWIPREILSRLRQNITDNLADMTLSGIDVPPLIEGTVGQEARALGAACLPLSEHFLVNANE